MRSGKSENITVLASHSIVKEQWVFLTRIYRKKVALSGGRSMAASTTRGELFPRDRARMVIIPTLIMAINNTFRRRVRISSARCYFP